MKREDSKTSTSLRRYYPVQVIRVFLSLSFLEKHPGDSCGQEPGAKYDKGGIVGWLDGLIA
jgi:hypothetical protein